VPAPDAGRYEAGHKRHAGYSGALGSDQRTPCRVGTGLTKTWPAISSTCDRSRRVNPCRRAALAAQPIVSPSSAPLLRLGRQGLAAWADQRRCRRITIRTS
jgi:hypothetical protein